MVLKGCIGVIQVEEQFGQSEHGGLELHGVLGIAYCSRTQEGEMEAGVDGGGVGEGKQLDVRLGREQVPVM